MNFIINFFRNISYFFYNLFSPFREARFFLRRIQTSITSPIGQISRALQLYRIRTFFSQISYNIRAPFRYFKIRLPQGIKKPFQRFGLFKPKEGQELPTGETRDYVYYRPHRRDRRWSNTVESEEFSQIHLIHQATGKRTILHIGTPTHSSTIETILNNAGHPPIRLRFQQVNPDTYKSQILMTHVAGHAYAVSNNVPLIRGIPVQHEMTFMVNEARYTCELHVTGSYEAPNVTRVNAAWFTSVGARRTNNEDAIGIYQHRDAYLFVIADGVGGGEVGELVSEFSVRYLLTAFHKNLNRGRADWSEILQQAVKRINEEVYYFSRRTPGITKTGTTLTAVIIYKWDAFIIHVGDSRLYHWSNGEMSQVTTDHKMTIIDQNTVNPNQGQREEKTVLSKAIGRSVDIHPDVHVMRFQPNDKFLLCTDGVTDTITNREIAKNMALMQPDELADYLIETTNNRHTTDNSSVIAIDVLTHGFNWDAWRARPDERVFVNYAGVRPLRVVDMHGLPTEYEAVTPIRIANVILLIVVVTVLLRIVL